MSELFVIRHGMRIDHEDRNWRAGASRTFDPPLSPTGEQQARATGAYLKRTVSVAAIYASPLLRTIQTGHAIADALDLPLRIEAGLVEWLNPKWHDFSAGWLDPAELKGRFPRLQWGKAQLVQPRYPEANEQIIAHRVQYTARHLATLHQGALVLVTHGVCVHHIVDGLTAGQGKAVDKTCAINVLKPNGDRWRLAESVVSHLAAQEETATYI